MRYFGKSWGAPVNESGEQSATPVGTGCAGGCGRAIEEGDRGVLLPYYGPIGPVEDRLVVGYGQPPSLAYHLSCMARMVLGPDAPEPLEGMGADVTKVLIADGVTASGRRLNFTDTDDPYKPRIEIDGRVALIGDARLYRDGGTREFRTDLGTVRLPHRIGDDDRRARLDGEVVEVPDGTSNTTEGSAR